MVKVLRKNIDHIMQLLNEDTLRNCKIISFNMDRSNQGQQKLTVKFSYPKHRREQLQRDINLTPHPKIHPEPEEV